MSRRLQAHIAELDVQPNTYTALEGADSAMVRSSAAGVAWDILADTCRRGTHAHGSAYIAETTGDLFAARASLPADAGVYTTDDAWDIDANGERTARSPTITAAGLREWTAIELLFNEPEDSEGAATVRFRAWDGTQELWWDGADWTTAADSEEWNDAETFQGNFAAFPASIRSLAIVAWLRTDDDDYTPAFYGARVAYGCRQVSALDDALFRTLLVRLKAEIRATGVIELTTTDTTASFDVGDPEFAYEVFDVEAVYNLTDDPDELSPLDGTFDDGEWVPDTPIETDQIVRIEYTYRPDLVVRRHQDAVALERLPAVYIAPSGTGQTSRAQDRTRVRDTISALPTAAAFWGVTNHRVALDVRIVGELGNDVQRLAASVVDFLGDAGYRLLVSPETGEVITVRQTLPPIETTGTLTQGVSEARATWELEYSASIRASTVSESLIRQGGISVDTFEE